MKKLKRHKRAACTRRLVEPAAHFNFKSFLIAAFCFSLIIEVNQDYTTWLKRELWLLGNYFVQEDYDDDNDVCWDVTANKYI